MNIRTLILNSEICKELLKHRNILAVTEDPQRVLHQVKHNVQGVQLVCGIMR